MWSCSLMAERHVVSVNGEGSTPFKIANMGRYANGEASGL